MIETSGDSLAIGLVLGMIISLFIGMGLPIVASYVILAIFAVGALTEFGVPTMAAHMISYWVAVVSAVTPPVALAAYAASAISGADPVKTGFEALRLASMIFVMPFLFVADTALIMQGGAREIAIAVAAVAFGIWAVGAGINGYFLTALKPWERGLALAAGGLLLVSRFDLPLENVFLGVGAAGTAAVYLLTRRRA